MSEETFQSDIWEHERAKQAAQFKADTKRSIEERYGEEQPDGFLSFNKKELLSRRRFQWGQSFFIDLGDGRTLQIGDDDMINGGTMPVAINKPYERVLEIARNVAAEQGFKIEEDNGI